MKKAIQYLRQIGRALFPPGRQAKEETGQPREADKETGRLAPDLLRAFGGAENIAAVDACLTRLRVTVNDRQKVDVSELKRLGAADVLERENEFQAVFGTQADRLRDQINEWLAQREKIAAVGVPGERESQVTPPERAGDGVAREGEDTVNDFRQVKELELVAPLSGTLLPLENVPDQVFSQKMMGDGFAIAPDVGEAVSPVDGKVKMIFPTRHAIGLETDGGREILIHVGIDTVNMEGEGFHVHVEPGQEVQKGDKLLTFDLEKIRAKATSTITPVVITALGERERLAITGAGQVKKGETPVAVIIHNLREGACSS
ncbi:hypothetical protein BSNK01_14350 [Bacillaceae bacterium]